MSDGMQNGPYPKLLLELATAQGKMEEKLNEVVAAIASMREDQKANSFTRKDIILAAIGSVGSFAVLGTGLFFLIGTVVTPVHQELTTFEATTIDRFRVQAETSNDRFKAMQEAIAANRLVNVEQDKEVNQIRLDLARARLDIDKPGK